jgi:peptidoglycan LD-endopeptidase LytH
MIVIQLKHIGYTRPVTWSRARLATAILGLGLLGPSLLLGHVGGAAAQSDDDAAARAAAEIQAARDRANAAAEAWTQAGIELDELSEEAEDLEAEYDELAAEVDALRGETEQVAINRYVAAGTGMMTIFEGPEASTDQLVSSELVATATNSSTAALDEYAEAATDLEELREELEDKQDELAAQRDEYRQAQENAEAEVERLKEIEAQRLEDERVARILAEQRAAELAAQQAAAEAAAQAAAAQAQAQASAQVQSQAAAGGQQQTQNGQAPAPEVSGDGSQLPTAPAPSGSGGASQSGDPATLPSPDPPLEPSLPQAAPPAAAPAASGMICPVSGAAYSDTWGASRSGGRSHQGVDMLAAPGTPIYAVVSGSVHFKQTNLGGNSIWLAGGDGNRYFFAHLSAFEGSDRGVSQGEVIGYVGDTGNARGTPHLHFEVHPGGGAAVNPYPYVRQAGC